MFINTALLKLIKTTKKTKKGGIDNINTTKGKVQFMANVEFGIISQKCRNFGICKILPDYRVTEKKAVNQKPSCFSIITLSKKRLKIAFLKTYLAQDDEKKYFKSGYFQIDEDIEVSQVLSLPNQAIDIRISKGLYPLKETEEAYIVLF